jgi:hypothetical protein
MGRRVPLLYVSRFYWNWTRPHETRDLTGLTGPGPHMAHNPKMGTLNS